VNTHINCIVKHVITVIFTKNSKCLVDVFEGSAKMVTIIGLSSQRDLSVAERTAAGCLASGTLRCGHVHGRICCLSHVEGRVVSLRLDRATLGQLAAKALEKAFQTCDLTGV